MPRWPRADDAQKNPGQQTTAKVVSRRGVPIVGISRAKLRSTLKSRGYPPRPVVETGHLAQHDPLEIAYAPETGQRGASVRRLQLATRTQCVPSENQTITNDTRGHSNKPPHRKMALRRVRISAHVDPAAPQWEGRPRSLTHALARVKGDGRSSRGPGLCPQSSLRPSPFTQPTGRLRIGMPRSVAGKCAPRRSSRRSA